ncbi:MAG: YihY/virulence factor BrkB family protein [Candidatus Acidiferrales bacterium]
MRKFFRCLWKALGRIWPACITQAQAAAFNMFIAFFPMILLVLGVVSSWGILRSGVEEMINGLGPLMPPGIAQVMRDFLERHAEHPVSWISVGLLGTLLAGTQMMRMLIEGFHLAQGKERPSPLRQIPRALGLLIVTLAPTVLAIALAVFGKQMRITMQQQFGSPVLIRVLFSIGLTLSAWVLAVLVLAVVYRVGIEHVNNWQEVLPGAIVATPIWWLVSWCFGLYMRHVPYDLVYGGLATAIGLLLWMNLTTVIILFGAAYNAENCGGARFSVSV